MLIHSPGMNCEKNGVVCEGYHEKQIWRSGKDRADEGKAELSNPLPPPKTRYL